MEKDKKKEKKMTATEKWAAKNKKKPSTKGLPGKGTVKKLGYTIEDYHKKLQDI